MEVVRSCLQEFTASEEVWTEHLCLVIEAFQSSSKVSCPECMVTLWEQFGNTILPISHAVTRTVRLIDEEIAQACDGENIVVAVEPLLDAITSDAIVEAYKEYFHWHTHDFQPQVSYIGSSLKWDQEYPLESILVYPLQRRAREMLLLKMLEKKLRTHFKYVGTVISETLQSMKDQQAYISTYSSFHHPILPSIQTENDAKGRNGTLLQRRPKGVSALGILAFLGSISTKEDLSTEDVVNRFIIPLSQESGRAFANDPAHAPDMGFRQGDTVGDADCFVSHRWGASFRSLVQAVLVDALGIQDTVAVKNLSSIHSEIIKAILEKKQPTKFYWIDIFFKNQHSINDLSTMEEFRTTLSCTKYLVCVLDDWPQFQSLSRIWCIYELFVAWSAQVPIELSTSFQAFDALRFNPERKLRKQVDSISVRHAQATVESDKHLILRLIDENHLTGGVDRLDRALRTVFLRALFAFQDDYRRALFA